MSRCRFILVTLAVLSVALPSRAADFGKLRVFIDATTSDIVGKSLVFTLKERVRASTSLELLPAKGSAHVHLHVTTTPLATGEEASVDGSTVWAITWTFPAGGTSEDEIYWSQAVGWCHASHLEKCAIAVVASTDDIATAFRAAFDRASEAKRQARRQ